MSKATVDLTVVEKDMLVGGPHGDPYPVPSEADFDEGPAPGRLAADDLEAMARRLIAFDRLKIGYLADFAVRVIWMKAGGTSGGKPVFGTVQLASADDKFFASERDDDAEPFDAKVRLAADNLREAKATRWNVGYELAGLLCRIGLHVTQKTGDKRLILVAPDASYSFAQMDVFGPQSPEIKRQFFEVKQQQFDWAQRLSEADFADEGGYDPSVDLPAGVDAELGPVEGGAPEVDWAERSGIAGEAWGDPAFEWGAEESVPDFSEHLANVRENFATKVIRLAEEPETEVEVCARCGVGVLQHDPEVCSGGTPESRKRRSRKIPHDFSQIAGEATGAAPEGLPVIGETALSGLYDAATLPHANGNGSHDPAVGDAFREDDFADGRNRDPAMVVRTLTEAGRQIVFEDGAYRHPSGIPFYSNSWVEGEYRTVVSGRVV